VPIKTVNGAPVYMRDVAQVRDGYQVQTNIVRADGKRSALLTALRHKGASTLAVVDRVKKLLPAVEATLRLAERLYEDNKNQAQQGTRAPIEVTRVNAAVAASRQALITAQGLVRQQELIVKRRRSREGGLPNPQILAAHIIPTDNLTVPAEEPGQALSDMVATALRNRPDLAGPVYRPKARKSV
jgi:outer membrane protein TolC